MENLCDQELLSILKNEVERSFELRQQQDEEFNHRPSYDEFRAFIEGCLIFANKPQATITELQIMFGNFILIRQNRFSLARVLLMRLDHQEKESDDQEIFNGKYIGGLALNIGLDIRDNWGMGIIGRKQEDVLKRISSVFDVAFGPSLNSSTENVLHYKNASCDSRTVLQLIRHPEFPSHRTDLSFHGTEIGIAQSILQVTTLLNDQKALAIDLGGGGKSLSWPRIIHEYK